MPQVTKQKAGQVLCEERLCEAKQILAGYRQQYGGCTFSRAVLAKVKQCFVELRRGFDEKARFRYPVIDMLY